MVIENDRIILNIYITIQNMIKLEIHSYFYCSIKFVSNRYVNNILLNKVYY
jgi:hypothetical protein